jgi:short-subunit dehydrogenase involved in D-alanine esterification of teichoic acids
MSIIVEFLLESDLRKPGTKVIQIVPPLIFNKSSTSSGTFRTLSVRSRAFECENITGTELTSRESKFDYSGKYVDI